MSKLFVATLVVLTLLIDPAMANAGLFGSSFDGCKDPGDDIAGYILEKSGDSTLTRSSIEQALKFVPTDVENVTYGDIFGWLRVTENTAECFTQNEYEKGLEIIGTHAGEFVASKALGVAVVQLVGGGVFLPAKVFEWGVDSLIKRIEGGAVNHQLVLYIAAVESCEESYGSRAECQQMIIDESKYGNTGNFPTAFLSQIGFILDAAVPKNPKFTNVAAVESINPEIELNLSGQIKITAQEFYRGAAVVYDAIVAKYSGSFDKVEATAIAKVTAEAKQIVKTNTGVGKESNNGGFFSNLWESVIDFFTSPKETEIKPSDLNGQISKPLSGDVNEAVPNLSQESNTPSQIQEEQRQAEEQRTKTATPVQPSNSSDQLKPQPVQQPSPTTTQVKTIKLRYKTGCDRNWGSPTAFVSLDWDVSYENMTSQTIYRNNEVILNAPPSVGPSYFDGTIKAGRTYNYVIKAEYKDGHSNSAEANIAVPIDVCGPINPVQNETSASQPPSTSPTPSVAPPAPSSGGGGSGSIPQTNIPPTPKSNFITLTKSKVVDQFGIPFEHILITCQRKDGSSCNMQSDFGSYIRFGPISDRDNPFLDGEYTFTIQGGAQGGLVSNAAVKTITIAHADGSVIDIGEVILKRWGRIFVSPVDRVGNPRLVYWELEGVFDDDLCITSPLLGIGSLNMDYYCSNGKSFYNYSMGRSTSSYFKEYPLPDGQYILKAFDSLYSSTESLYETTVRISQGQDVDLGIVEIKP